MTNISPSFPRTPKRSRCWAELSTSLESNFFFPHELVHIHLYTFRWKQPRFASLVLPALFSHCAHRQPMSAPPRDFCSVPEVLFVAQPQLIRHPASINCHQVAPQWQFIPTKLLCTTKLYVPMLPTQPMIPMAEDRKLQGCLPGSTVFFHPEYLI